MTSESMKLYKLIILYFLSKTSQPMSNAIISDFMLENCYADYFSIQQTLSDLTEDNMINTEQTHSKSYYTIAPKGQETLDFFGNKLPNDTKQQIEDYLVKNKVSIIENTTIHTDFTRLRNKEYLAKCSILERGSVIMEVAINVPSEEEAIQVCQRFKDKNEQIYGFLFRTLSED
ncbi:MAG: DUF4364 family protein [Lachnospiraceae bacterium]|nr:DUF4364 family protein [Lachnospiraceae bacterium]MCI5588754.1 DUF4364 family protein [Lachnospiraceae bacterium]